MRILGCEFIRKLFSRISHTERAEDAEY